MKGSFKEGIDFLASVYTVNGHTVAVDYNLSNYQAYISCENCGTLVFKSHTEIGIEDTNVTVQCGSSDYLTMEAWVNDMIIYMNENYDGNYF